jgi:hemerythrin-like domain-containing protein
MELHPDGYRPRMAEKRTTASSSSKSSGTTTTDPLRILRADHREVEQLLTKLAETDEGAERERMIEEVRTKLTLHMELEEQLLYPLVADKVGHEDEEEAEVEHTLARDGLDKLVSMSTVPGFGAVVEMLKAGIKHHVEDEEKELLPALKESMERDEWRALGEQPVEAKQAAGQPVTSSNTSNGRRSTKRKKAA